MTGDALRSTSWWPVVEAEMAKPYWGRLQRLVAGDRASTDVYPPAGQELRALELCPLDKVRCVILGQDPYHGPSQAHGLAFSVPVGVEPPPSLRNVLDELGRDLGQCPWCERGFILATGIMCRSCGGTGNAAGENFTRAKNKCGDLTPWAENGVLLLNTVLTVRRGEPKSHANITDGWEQFTSAVVKAVADLERPVGFVLWGSDAFKLATDLPLRHPVVYSAHPSPLSAHRGFIGSRPFSKINAELVKLGADPVDWSL